MYTDRSTLPYMLYTVQINPSTCTYMLCTQIHPTNIVMYTVQVSDYCLMPYEQFFSHIMERTSYIFDDMMISVLYYTNTPS